MKKFLLICALIFPHKHGFAETQNSSPTLPSFAKTYTNYTSMRDALADKIFTAQRQVLLKTTSLQDNEIALSLFGAKTKGLIVEVTLEAASIKSPFSQFQSLKHMEIPVHVAPSVAIASVRTFVTIDDESYFIQSPLQSDLSGEIKVEAAKASTKTVARPLTEPATIKHRVNLKNSEQFRMVQKQMPHETRAERIKRGKPVSEINEANRAPKARKPNDQKTPAIEREIE